MEVTVSDVTWDEGQEGDNSDRTEESPVIEVLSSYRITWTETVDIHYYDEDHVLICGTRVIDGCMVLLDELKANEMLRFMWSQNINATMVYDDNLTLPTIRKGKRKYVWGDELTS